MFEAVFTSHGLAAFLSSAQNELKLSLPTHLVKFGQDLYCIGSDNFFFSVICFNKVNIIKVKGHLKQKDFTRLQSVKSQIYDKYIHKSSI